MEFRMMVNIYRKRFANTTQKVKIILSLEDIEEEKNRRRELILQRVRSLHPTDFEHLIAVILRKLGYKDVKVIGGSGDNCIDILARDENDEGVAVQCKKYTTKKVTARDIQTFLGMMLLEEHVYKGIYITTSKFTRGVYKLSEKYYNTLILIDGYKLADILKEIHIDY
jgi:restriction system protein